MSGLIEQILGVINKISGGNQMIAGAISLWLLGVCTFMLRNVPKKIYQFLVKHFTTSLTILSRDQAYHRFTEWLQEEGYADKFRRVKATNGSNRWDEDANTYKTIGYGTHILWYKGRPIMIRLVKEDANATSDLKEYLEISKLGRSHRLIDDLISMIRTRGESDDTTAVHQHNGNQWEYISKQPKRSFESVVIKNDQLQQLKDTLDSFVAAEDWYIKHGIPYQLGILLHGPPGTGKTSLVRAIAAYMNKKMAIAGFGGRASMGSVFANHPEDSIIVIEDVDTSANTHKRVDMEGKEKGSEEGESDDAKILAGVASLMTSSSLSDLLNAIDGVLTTHGRIVVMTTNRKHVLDPALIRPGRIDLQLEIGYVDNEAFHTFMGRFFPLIPEELKRRRLTAKNLTGAVLQNEVLMKKSVEEIYGKFTELPSKTVKNRQNRRKKERRFV